MACVAAVLLVACGQEERAAPPVSERGATAPASSDAARHAASAPVDRASIDPAAVALNNRGVGLMGSFEFEQAEKAFAEALAQSPGWTDAIVNQAIAVLNQSAEGKQEAAVALLAPVLERDPGELRAKYASALCQLFLGLPENALPLFAAVAAADPRDAYAAYYHAQCLELAGDSAAALGEYRRATELDPYLRSALLGLQRCLQRTGQEKEASEALSLFQKLAENPRARLAEFKYTRMGRKGEALAAPTMAAPPSSANVAAITGPDAAFATRRAIVDTLPDGLSWNPAFATHSITTAEIDGDGRQDLFATSALRDAGMRSQNAVLLGGDGGNYTLDHDHPLSRVAGVLAALWGDVDNDGRTDVVLCSKGGTRLWKRTADGWQDATAATQTLVGAPSAGGLLADLDHDGDLDLLLVGGGQGGREAQLLINLDGSRFRDLTAEAIPSTVRVAQAVAGDFDGDRDLDLFLLGNGTPNALLRNDRLWAWTAWTAASETGGGGSSEVTNAAAIAAAAGDIDGDGTIDLVLLPQGEAPRGFSFPQRGEAAPIREARLAALPAGAAHFALADLRGDGELQPFAPADGDGRAEFRRGWSVVNLSAGGGPSLVGVDNGGAIWLHDPAPAMRRFAAIDFCGRLDPGQSMRSNASGIGTLVNARIGERWITRAALPAASTPGQSLEPMLIGLGDAPMIDFVFLDWSDGVFQSELAIGPDALRTIVETQRQISSCPLLFAWDGTGYSFVSDLLGVGGLGYLVAPGEYAPPRPWEFFLLDRGIPVERDGALELILHEPMEEAVYLDHVALTAIDLPPGWNVVLDERLGVAGPEPTGAALTFRRIEIPIRANAAWNGDEVDCTAAIGRADFDAAPIGPLDPRFIGRQLHEHVLTVEFDAPIDLASRAERGAPVLVADGWVEYPYGQTNFAAWQAGASFDPPTLEGRDGDGQWRLLLEKFGYPAGMPRGMALPLPTLPKGCTALRLRTNLELHWDSVAVAYAEVCPEARRSHLPLRSAELSFSGFPRRSDGAHRRPLYDYQDRAPLADMRTQPGFYSVFGAVDELVSKPDGALAIFGPGEEIRLRFAAPPPPDRFTRRYILETRGWCKDMDLFTADGESVEPVPGTRRDEAEALHRRFNTRFGGGR